MTAQSEPGARPNCSCCDEHAIAKLIYTYAERIDAGDFEAVADLLGDATVSFEEAPGRSVRGRDEALEMYTRFTRRFADNGTPHTRHVTTNLLIDVDASGARATCRSYFTVLQRTDTLALQPILAGRYHDTFEKVEGDWRFCHRHMLSDYPGDLSQHMLIAPF